LQDDFVEVGVISRAHGIKGEVKVQLITDEPKKRLGTAGRRCVRNSAAYRLAGWLQMHGLCMSQNRQ
jgi:ribosomal 30S subunit maturation factor RimM